MTLKTNSMSPKSTHFLRFLLCICASLVKIWQLVQMIECRQGLFILFYGPNPSDFENYIKFPKSNHTFKLSKKKHLCKFGKTPQMVHKLERQH